MPEIIERCNSCVLPRSGFFHFEQGTCSLCRGWKRRGLESDRKEDSPDELERHIEKIKEQGKGRPYDCVVGISGGRDSSYLLYLLRRRHELRCLAAYYRTPFTPPATNANARKLATQLDAPLVEMNISREFHRRIAREMVRLWMENPHPAIANMACAPCKLVNREVFKIAQTEGTKAIIYGSNMFEAVQIASSVSRDSVLNPDATAARRYSLPAQLKKTLMLARRGTDALSKSRGLWRYITIGIQASLMYISPHSPCLRLRYPGIQALEYFYLSGWSEPECEKALREVGWELPPGCKSSWKSDCTFAELKNLMFRKMTGVTYLDAFLSNMVRAGHLSREQALERIEVEGAVSEERLAEVCRILDLPPQAIRSLQS